MRSAARERAERRRSTRRPVDRRALRHGTDLGYDRLGGCRKDNEQGEDGLPELVCILVAILYDTYMHSLANRARARAAHAAPLYRLVQLYV